MWHKGIEASIGWDYVAPRVPTDPIWSTAKHSPICEDGVRIPIVIFIGKRIAARIARDIILERYNATRWLLSIADERSRPKRSAPSSYEVALRESPTICQGSTHPRTVQDNVHRCCIRDSTLDLTGLVHISAVSCNNRVDSRALSDPRQKVWRRECLFLLVIERRDHGIEASPMLT